MTFSSTLLPLSPYLPLSSRPAYVSFTTPAIPPPPSCSTQPPLPHTPLTGVWICTWLSPCTGMGACSRGHFNIPSSKRRAPTFALHAARTRKVGGWVGGWVSMIFVGVRECLGHNLCVVSLSPPPLSDRCVGRWVGGVVELVNGWLRGWVGALLSVYPCRCLSS